MSSLRPLTCPKTHQQSNSRAHFARNCNRKAKCTRTLLETAPAEYCAPAQRSKMRRGSHCVPVQRSKLCQGGIAHAREGQNRVRASNESSFEVQNRVGEGIARPRKGQNCVREALRTRAKVKNASGKPLRTRAKVKIASVELQERSHCQKLRQRALIFRPPRSRLVPVRAAFSRAFSPRL